MDYENINLNSYEYTKLSNEEKLKLVKSRIYSILNEKVDELIKNGATLTSVLVTRVDLANDITHEGYYNANNVRVRSR